MNNDWWLQLINPDGSASGPLMSLASLGIEDAVYDLNSMAADVFTFTVGGLDFDASALWPYGQLVALYRPDKTTRAFFGRVEPWTREGRPAAQNQMGRLVNPWWYFAHKIYEQQFKLLLDPTHNTFNTYTSPRVVLNILYDAVKGFANVSTGAQITDAVNWAILKGAPVKLGVVDPATMPYSNFQKGITVEDVIKMMFRLEPDFVVDWDYTTTPFPTVHFRKLTSMTPAIIDLTDASIMDLVKIRERPDWQRTYVKINYDQTNTFSGQQYLQLYSEWCSAAGLGYNLNGTTGGAALPADVATTFGGVDLYVDLTGANTTSQTAEMASQPFDITSAAQWIKWRSELAAPDITGVQIVNAPTNGISQMPTTAPLDEYDANGNPVAYDASCVYEIVDGAWADWMIDPNTKLATNSQRVRVSAYAIVTRNKGTGGSTQSEIKFLTHDLTVVNTNTKGIFQNFSSNPPPTAYAEAIPGGLSQSMWNSWQNLAIEGEINDTEVVCGSNGAHLPNGSTGPLTRSMRLNFEAAGAAGNNWAKINAMIQHISGTLATGHSQVQFGAPLHLTGHELIDAVRVTRFRASTIDLNYLFGGALPSSQAIRAPRKTHARHSQGSSPQPQIHVISQNIAPTAGTDPVIVHDGTSGVTTWAPPHGPVAAPVTIDPRRSKGSDGNWHPITLQEQKIAVKGSDGSCKQRTMIIMCSNAYQAPDDPA